MATKAKKPATKKAPARKPAAKKSNPRSAAVSRRPLITRNDEYTQTTWILIGIWIVLIAIFLGAVVKQMN